MKQKEIIINRGYGPSAVLNLHVPLVYFFFFVMSMSWTKLLSARIRKTQLMLFINRANRGKNDTLIKDWEPQTGPTLSHGTFHIMGPWQANWSDIQANQTAI